MSDDFPAGPLPARFGLDEQASRALRDQLPALAERTVTRITAEVPSYSGTLTGQMREKIENAVQIALGTFLNLMERSQGIDPSTPLTHALAAAYALGSGEARAGRSMDALLAAYRVGARVAWREMSTTTVRGGLPAATVAEFAELMFAYIDELSAASVAGHADELASAGQARRRNLERLTHLLLAGEAEEALRGRADRADWPVPQTLTAVLLPRSTVRGALARLDPHTLDSAEDLPGVEATEELSVLLVPDMHAARRAHLLRTLHGLRAVVGPARPWHRAAFSYRRALRARQVGLGEGGDDPVDTERHLAELLLGADPESLADLRAQALAPLSDLPPATAHRLAETLRSWLLHQGRRDQVAADLFVHPQTVRYRMGRLRERYADRLDDPAAVLDLTVALAFLPPPPGPDRPDPAPQD
ncbi:MULTISPECIES: PucR family transcriptional regulator [Micromonospora]|uniref:PucR C-terminal helix-turn-helix domain-containing protein n=1 Tax=Micromonospora yangpuensis TaxID=683228 RepID=A0A1C6UUT0_9ACTN|nr:PucR family transcriptional regulator [Micromonospora yangpuensis]GGM23816.1 hypothetical protein GCM10012279_47670 [Micromonospora yangpuensis]SCL57805.1 PucR C-terminal helix-turn-helix domain-containing protein [Micromonospora yangpuensis]